MFRAWAVDFYTKNQLHMKWEVSWVMVVPPKYIKLYWLVVSIPLKNISQLGWLFPIYGKIKNVPNHQPVYHCSIETNGFFWMFWGSPIFPEPPMPYPQAPSYISIFSQRMQYLSEHTHKSGHFSMVYMVFVVQCQLSIMFALHGPTLRCEQPMGNSHSEHDL